MKSGLTLILVLACGSIGYSQGCSDAGFCSIGTLGNQPLDTVNRSGVLAVLLNSGVGDEGVFIFSPAIQYDKPLSASVTLQAKVTANYASGNLGRAAGPGDVYATAIISPGVRDARRFSHQFTLGFKAPLNGGNLELKGRSLPMAYQSSLGTFDVIAGLTLTDNHWQFTVGLQQPLTSMNRNGFDPSQWVEPEAANYVPSNDLRRKGDILLRAIRYINVRERLRLSVGLLGIYHVANDEYRGTDSDMRVMILNGSKGLTLNVTGSASFLVGQGWSVGFVTGVPLIVRESRPDGLTRSFVFAPEIRYRF